MIHHVCVVVVLVATRFNLSGETHAMRRASPSQSPPSPDPVAMPPSRRSNDRAVCLTLDQNAPCVATRRRTGGPTWLSHSLLTRHINSLPPERASVRLRLSIDYIGDATQNGRRLIRDAPESLDHRTMPSHQATPLHQSPLTLQAQTWDRTALPGREDTLCPACMTCMSRLRAPLIHQTSDVATHLCLCPMPI